MQVSYTKLKTFDDCALRYRLAYVERLARPPIVPLAPHRRIHAALRRFHELTRADGVVRPEELLTQYDQVMSAGKATRHLDVQETAEYADGIEILSAYADREARRGTVPLLLEHALRVPFGPYTLTGRIDRVDLLPASSTGGDSYALVDYKLVKKMPDGNPASSDRQLPFYALLLREGEGMRVTQMSLHYLRQDAVSVAPFTAVDLAFTLAWVDDTAGRIRAEKRWAPCEGEICGNCPYKNICPAKTGRPREAKTVYDQAAFTW